MIDPNDYWVNNPLITPINKALLYDNAIFMAKADEQDRILDEVNFFLSDYDNDDFFNDKLRAIIRPEGK